MPIRGELSIIACILTLGHNAAYGLTYFRFLFTQPSRLPANQLAAAVCSLVMICIMLPLFVTSFQSVRRKMSGRSWKRLQRLAYGFYGLLYVHIMLLTLPLARAGRGGYLLNALVYSVVFLGYGLCRAMKARAVRGGQTEALPRRQTEALAGALALSLCLTAGLKLSAPASQNTAQGQMQAEQRQEEQAARPAAPDPQPAAFPAPDSSLPPETPEEDPPADDGAAEDPAPQAGAQQPAASAQAPQTAPPPRRSRPSLSPRSSRTPRRRRRRSPSRSRNLSRSRSRSAPIGTAPSAAPATALRAPSPSASPFRTTSSPASP